MWRLHRLLLLLLVLSSCRLVPVDLDRSGINSRKRKLSELIKKSVIETVSARHVEAPGTLQGAQETADVGRIGELHAAYEPAMPFTARDVHNERSTALFRDFDANVMHTIFGFSEVPSVAALGCLNSHCNHFVRQTSPARLLAEHLGLAELALLPTTPDLKFLFPLTRSLLVKDLPCLLVDVLYVKHLPHIKGPLLRGLYRIVRDQIASDRDRHQQLFQDFMSHSASVKNTNTMMHALERSFFELGDYETVLAMWDRHPALLPCSLFDRFEEMVHFIERRDGERLLQHYFGHCTPHDLFKVAYTAFSESDSCRVIDDHLRVQHDTTQLREIAHLKSALSIWMQALTLRRGPFTKQEADVMWRKFVSFTEQCRVFYSQTTNDREIDQHTHVSALLVRLLVEIRMGRRQEAHSLLEELPIEETRLGEYQLVFLVCIYQNDIESFHTLLRKMQATLPRVNLTVAQLRYEIVKSVPFSSLVARHMNVFGCWWPFSQELHGETVSNSQFLLASLNLSDDHALFRHLHQGSLMIEYAVRHFDTDRLRMLILQTQWSVDMLKILLTDMLALGKDCFWFELVLQAITAGRVMEGESPAVVIIDLRHLLFFLMNPSLDSLFTLPHVLQFCTTPAVVAEAVLRLDLHDLLGARGTLLNQIDVSMADVVAMLPHQYDVNRLMRFLHGTGMETDGRG